jgi:hypothetical protein
VSREDNATVKPRPDGDYRLTLRAKRNTPPHVGGNYASGSYDLFQEAWFLDVAPSPTT